MPLNNKGQVHESLERHPITSSDEHKEGFLLLQGHFIDHPPEHGDGRVVVGIPLIVGRGQFQLVEVNHRAAADQKLELVRTKQRECFTATYLKCENEEVSSALSLSLGK